MTCRNILTLFALTICLISCRPENADKRTDTVTKLAIRYLNEHKLDSLYQLTDSAFRKRIPRNMFMSSSEKSVRLLPLINIDFLTGNDSVSIYHVDGKIPLMCYIGLNTQGKIKIFAFGPYQADVKHVSIGADERRTDVLAHKVMNLIQRKQLDSIYLLASNAFKSKVSASQWRNDAGGMLEYVPFAPAFFLRSDNGVNAYAEGPYRFMFGGLDADGKFNTLYFQLYIPTATKTEKAPTDNKLKTPLDNVVDKVVSTYIQRLGNVGISVGVLYKGNTCFYNYGERKQGQKILPDNHTLYDIGSVTKTFTGTLLAIAVNQKKITLETPVVKYLPDSVANNPGLKNFTFKQLANHTSGLPRDGSNYKDYITNVDQLYENYDNAAMFSFLKHFKPTRQPGVQYSYSNLGFGLLGVLLERIYQKTYPELLSEYITRPLNMNETVTAIDTLRFKDLAQGYDGLLQPVPYFKIAALRAAGEIKSSAYDLMTYAKAQLSTPGPLLNAGIQLAHQVTFKGRNIPGLGWEYLPGNPSVLVHGGATGGYRSVICVDLNKQIAVVVLTNNTGNGDAVGYGLIKELQELKDGN